MVLCGFWAHLASSLSLFIVSVSPFLSLLFSLYRFLSLSPSVSLILSPAPLFSPFKVSSYRLMRQQPSHLIRQSRPLTIRGRKDLAPPLPPYFLPPPPPSSSSSCPPPPSSSSSSCPPLPSLWVLIATLEA
jgi:hypothetical protein